MPKILDTGFVAVRCLFRSSHLPLALVRIKLFSTIHQRTAYVGHFGSYLLDQKNRELVISLIEVAVAAVSIPIFVKIRLLDTYEETLELVQQLHSFAGPVVALHYPP